MSAQSYAVPDAKESLELKVSVVSINTFQFLLEKDYPAE